MRNRRRLTKEEALLIVKEFMESELSKKKWYVHVKKSIKAIVLYGSVAKGLNRPDSDIDLLIILPLATEEKHTTGEYVYIFKGYEINIVLRSIERLRKLAKTNDAFQAEVFRRSKILWEKDKDAQDLIRQIIINDQQPPCPYCPFTSKYLILKEYRYWILSLAESQFLIGWSHAILRRHVESFEELSDEELIELKQVVRDFKKVLKRGLRPDLLNVMQLGNIDRHVHIHLVPRYKSKRTFAERIFTDKDWGKVVPQQWEPEKKKFLIKLRKYLQQQMKRVEKS